MNDIIVLFFLFISLIISTLLSFYLSRSLNFPRCIDSGNACDRLANWTPLNC